MLVYIEFNLEDKSKNISFEVNKYEIYSKGYKRKFKEEKIKDTFKFIYYVEDILCFKLFSIIIILCSSVKMLNIELPY